MDQLIPPLWFEPLASWLLLVIVAASMAALIKGADWLVDGASNLAYGLGVPKVIIGATIVSLGTTSPEAAVSVMAAWTGNPGLALGNAVGSVIADTGLIFGLGCLLAVLPADRFILNRQGWVQFGAGMLLTLICFGKFAASGDSAAIGRTFGGFMLLTLVAYLVLSVKWSRGHRSSNPGLGAALDESPLEKPSAGIAVSLGLIVLGVTIVVFSSHVLITSVTILALRWGIPQVVIAATLVALGTSLPELATAIASIVKGHKDLLVGNVIGADVLNILFVIPASAVASPLPVVEKGTSSPHTFLYLQLPFMVLVLGLFRIYIAVSEGRGRFSRWMGLPLVVIYTAFVSLSYILTR